MRLYTLILLIFPLFVLTGENKPNFVFLLVDDLGWGDFGCFGAEFYETPNIDRLAGEGKLFTNGYAACTVCSPSRAAILTGRYPARLRLTDWITGHNRPFAKLTVPDWNMRISHQRVLLPEALKQAGYDTAFIGKWHLMPIGQPDFEEHYPTNHGFDMNIGGCEWGQPKGKGIYFSPFDMPNLDDGEPDDFLTDKLTDAAIDFLDTRDSQIPFLLYFAYYTLHSPIMAPPELVEKYEGKAKSFPNAKDEWFDARRAGMVESLDNSIGRIIAKLEQMGIADNTIVILTGDNGGDHNKTTGGLRGRKGYSHEGGVRVPLIIKWPGITEPRSICDYPVMGTDFYPTILEMACLPPRPEEHIDGISLVPLLSEKQSMLSRQNLYWHYPHYHRTAPYGAIRSGDWKLIEYFEDEKLELYNLNDDPKETKNLADQYPEKTEELLYQLEAWRKSTDAQMMQPNPQYQPENPNT